MNLILIGLIIIVISCIVIYFFFDSFANISINDRILVNNISTYIYSNSNKKQDIDIIYKKYLKLLENNDNKYKSLVLYENFNKLLNLAYSGKLRIDDIMRLMK